MGALFRAFDWASTPIGSADSWPESLRTMVGVVLANPFPMLIWWGPELRHLYNDAYRPMLGAKHPASLGQPASEVWAEIWHIVGPRALQVLSGGGATFDEDLHLPMDRYGYVEETYFTFSYSPIPDSAATNGVGGVLVTVTETTARVVGERRVRALRDLGARASEAKTAEEACRIAAETLDTHARDVPFSLIYLLDAATPHLVAAAGTLRGSANEVAAVDALPVLPTELTWAVDEVLRTGRAQTVTQIGRNVRHAPGPWPQPPNTAIVLAIPSAVPDQPAGILIAGVSPRLALDEAYRGFIEVVASQVGIAIANARAYEEERRRAESLAELDRAKTLFFSNVSHEFRTPLTLLLGPAESLLDDAAIGAEQRDQVQVIHRNALRLLKLVNTLLDFSRIESGRIAAAFEPTDLATYTGELASNFRAAIEAAGMQLIIDAPPLPEPVYVDRDMWEKVMLNLLSNAFKHTFAGEIAVRVRADGATAQITVSDTGVGIAADQVPHIFERFHRVPNARSRTHEGTGIGLSLVQELVRQHGGRIDVASVEGAGTTFTVSIPFGAAHLPRDRVRATGDARVPRHDALGASPYVEEALRWLPDQRARSADAARVRPIASTGATPYAPPHILVADDNADMRHYVVRLLEAEGWTVEAVSDGMAALEAARARAPDVVLSDVMMPGLSGFGLLQELRADPRTTALPVILLSARAGEEARVEGAAAGADDYLVKPFSAQELVARVGAHVRLARIRAEVEGVLRQRTAQFETLLNVAPLGVYLVDGDFRIRVVNPIALPVFGDIPDLVGRDFDDVMHILWPTDYADQIVRLFRHTLRTGEPYATPEQSEHRRDRNVTEYYEWQINRIALPDGRFGVVCYFRDISLHVQARKALEDARRQAEDAKRVAESANSAKSEFLTAMSHELRTPLNAIAGYAQLLEMGVHGPITDAQHEALGRIQRSEAHLLALINDVLNFAKLEAGRVVVSVEHVPLAATAAEVVSMVEPQLAAKRLRIEQRVPASLVARADGEKVRQVLLNLLSNAVKFTDAGGAITIDVPPNDEADGDAAGAGSVRVRVRDTGCGIAREKQEAIFEPFVQLGRTIGTTSEGTGLGLAISRDLARGMGGDLVVESVEGAGSDFTLTLPSADRAG
jgi:PAS domain S-box-containing protein